MGRYFGVRSTEADELIAMGGERIVFPGYSEMSGLCTHPEHRGKGYAAHLLWHLAALHRAQGIVSWLHVTATNSTAVNLYLKLGFQTVRSIKLHRLGCA
jgi:predicted GNAT family acetyltransferase